MNARIRRRKLICGHASDGVGMNRSLKSGTYLLGSDLYSSKFQHDFLNSLPTTSMVLDLLRFNRSFRVIGTRRMTNLLKLYVGQQYLQGSSNHNVYERIIWIAPIWRTTTLIKGDSGADKVFQNVDRSSIDSYPYDCLLNTLPSLAFTAKVKYPLLRYVLFLTRKDEKKRRLNQESDVIEVVNSTVAAAGVFLLIFRHTNTYEDALLFRNAIMVVGLHGGAFTNIIFCSVHTVVLEIAPPPDALNIRYCFAAIGYHRGFRYFMYPASMFDYTEGATVDIEHFKAFFEVMFSVSRATEGLRLP